MKINGTQLHAMRDKGVNISLPDLVDVLRAVESDDGASGTRTRTQPVSPAGGVPCQIGAMTFLPTPQQAAGQPQIYVRLTVVFQHDADVKAKDTLRDRTDGTLLRVIEVDPDRADSLSRQAFCEKVSA